MAPMSPVRCRLRAEIARGSQRNPDDPRLKRLRQQLKCEGVIEHIQQLVDRAPPLTDEQRDRLTLILRPVIGPEESRE